MSGFGSSCTLGIPHRSIDAEVVHLIMGSRCSLPRISDVAINYATFAGCSATVDRCLSMGEAPAHSADVALARYRDAPAAEVFLAMFGQGTDVQQLLSALAEEQGTMAAEATLRRQMRHWGFEMGVEEVVAWAKRLGARMPKTGSSSTGLRCSASCTLRCASAVASAADVGCLLGVPRRAPIRFATIWLVRSFVGRPRSFLGRDDRWLANGTMRHALFLDAAGLDDRTSVLRALWQDAVQAGRRAVAGDNLFLARLRSHGRLRFGRL